MPKPYYEALPPDRARDPSQVRSATVRGVLVAFARDVKSWRAVE
jgi:hypothetical protein